MTGIAISNDAFTIWRTPTELREYAQEVYDYIATHQEMKEAARLRKEPYKTFLEEFLPFSHFCEWRYGGRDDVLCSLVQGTPGRDAVVRDKASGGEHSVEITWPIDGQYVVGQGRQLNERSRTDFEVWDLHDLSRQESAVNRTIEIAHKKSLRDYRFPGGSTIIFVFDRFLFCDRIPRHTSLLNSLHEQLVREDLKADNVLLMLVFGDQQKVVVVKDTEQAAEGDAGNRGGASR